MPLNPIRLTHANDSLEIGLVERAVMPGRDQGDLRVAIAVWSGDFSGRNDQVWINADHWHAFTTALARLDRDRTGAASVASMSPGEFDLTIRVTDRAGHVVALGSLSRHHFWRDMATSPTRSTIAFHIEIDPSTLPDLLAQVASLGNENPRQDAEPRHAARMPADRLAAIVASFTQGASTDAEVSSQLLELAGTEGDARAVLSRLPPELLSLLREHPLIIKPPALPASIVIAESYCGPERLPAEDKKRYLEKQELAFRGAWNLHRALGMASDDL